MEMSSTIFLVFGMTQFLHVHRITPDNARRKRSVYNKLLPKQTKPGRTCIVPPKRYNPGDKVFFRIIKNKKSFGEMETIEKRVENMIYIIKGSQFTYKRHYNQRGPRHFWSRRACLGYGPVPLPTKRKALYHTRQVGGTNDKYRLFPSESRDTLRSAVWVVTRIWPGVSWFRWQLVEAGIHVKRAKTCIFVPQWGTFPQTQTLFGGTRFIAWLQRRPFLG